jgi:glyceraldehyde 3-phosphate dehydrogenase
MAHLLKYDSIHGVLPHKVGSDEKRILVEEKHFMFFMKKKFQIYLGKA